MDAKSGKAFPIVVADFLIVSIKTYHMQNERLDKDANNEKQNTSVQPDPETLHKTDPQKKMEGPVSSLLHNTGESFDSDETKERADEKRDKNM